jgi:hypothetical protein
MGGVVLGAALGDPVAYGQVLEPTLTEGATLRVEPAQLVLRVPPRARGFLDVRPPAAPSELLLPFLPRALAGPRLPGVRETVTWRARVERDNTYFVLVEVPGVLVQSTSWGLRVTSRAPGAAVPRQDDLTALPLDGAGWGDWALERGGGRVSLRLAGQEVWGAPQVDDFRFVRLGETRSDEQHGGTLWLSALRFRRRIG